MLSINKLFINSLIKSNKFSYYIHLKDHNKKINPQKNKVALSFMNPKNVKDNVPKQQSYLFNLKRKTQKQLERKMFEQYKEKVLKGKIDQDEEIFIDPLWGEGQKPKHYYQNLSKAQLMTASHPQNADFIPALNQMYQSFFKTTLNQLPTAQQLKSMKPSQLVNAAVYARLNETQSLDFWHNLQKSFGNKFYELNSDQLIQLNFALKGFIKKGTPRIHSIVNDLILQDLTKYSYQQLTALYFSFRNGKAEVVPIQDKILQQLQQQYQKMSFQQKVNWIFTYSIARKPQIFKKIDQKSLHQNLRKAHQLIFNVNFSSQISQQLASVQQCINLVYALAKLRAQNTRFLTDQIVVYLKSHIEQITQNVQQSARLLFYLQQIQGGAGVYDEQLFTSLINTVTQPNNFGSLSKINQLRSLYAIWNYNLMTDDIFQLYKSVQIEADSTELFYFCQIQLSRSSQRQWEVLRNLAELNHIPIPYYQAVKRFTNYMKVSAPDWDLTPIQDKLKNTEFFYNVLRSKDQFYNIKFYNNLMKYFKFSTQISPFQHTLPIQNYEISQFGNAGYQVSVDIVNESAFVPGTNELKQSYRNKIRSLSNIGWKHVVLRQKELNKLPAQKQLQQVIFAFSPYMEQQRAVIQNRDYYRGEELQSMRIQDYWDSMIAQEAQGYRNNPQQYAKKIAQIAEKQKKLSQDLAKVE